MKQSASTGTATEQVADIINSFIPEEGEFSVSEISARVFSYLREFEPDLLTRWQDEQSQEHVKKSLSTTLWKRNARTRKRMHKLRFAAAARTYEQRIRAGEDNLQAAKELQPFTEMTLVIDDQNNRKSIGEMTGPDHTFVANRYERTARAAGLQAAFHRAVAKKVGKDLTRNVMTENEYITLYNSIVNL